jgi:hypothetical protein
MIRSPAMAWLAEVMSSAWRSRGSRRIEGGSRARPMCRRRSARPLEPVPSGRLATSTNAAGARVDLFAAQSFLTAGPGGTRTPFREPRRAARVDPRRTPQLDAAHPIRLAGRPWSTLVELLAKVERRVAHQGVVAGGPRIEETTGDDARVSQRSPVVAAHHQQEQSGGPAHGSPCTQVADEVERGADPRLIPRNLETPMLRHRRFSGASAPWRALARRTPGAGRRCTKS